MRDTNFKTSNGFVSFMVDCSETFKWMPRNVRFNGNGFIDVINRAFGATAATLIFNGPFPTRFLFPFARWPSTFFSILFSFRFFSLFS